MTPEKLSSPAYRRRAAESRPEQPYCLRPHSMSTFSVPCCEHPLCTAPISPQSLDVRALETTQVSDCLPPRPTLFATWAITEQKGHNSAAARVWVYLDCGKGLGGRINAQADSAAFDAAKIPALGEQRQQSIISFARHSTGMRSGAGGFEPRAPMNGKWEGKLLFLCSRWYCNKLWPLYCILRLRSLSSAKLLQLSKCTTWTYRGHS